MKSTFFSLAAMVAVANALPAAQANAPTEQWAVNDFTIFSSRSTGEAEISFLTDAPDAPEMYPCSATLPAEEDGGVPLFERVPCGDEGTTFTFNPPTDDSTTVPSLIIYTQGEPDKMGVAMFRRDVLVLKNGTERWMGTGNFGITNIF